MYRMHHGHSAYMDPMLTAIAGTNSDAIPNPNPRPREPCALQRPISQPHTIRYSSSTELRSVYCGQAVYCLPFIAVYISTHGRVMLYQSYSSTHFNRSTAPLNAAAVSYTTRRSCLCTVVLLPTPCSLRCGTVRTIPLPHIPNYLPQPQNPTACSSLSLFPPLFLLSSHFHPSSLPPSHTPPSYPPRPTPTFFISLRSNWPSNLTLAPIPGTTCRQAT